MIQTNVSLLKYNTFGIDVSAAKFFEYSTEQELVDFIKSESLTAPYLHIGGGSNLLFTKDYPGLILHSKIKGIEVVDENANTISLRVGAGVIWDRFVAYCVDNEWYGVENLSLIPGEVGASAVQNIGAYGVEAKDFIQTVEVINIEGNKKVYDVRECGYGYRTSIFKHADHRDEFVTHVTFKLSKTPQYVLDYGTVRQELENFKKIDLVTVRQVIIDIRSTKLPDPEIMGNAGSFFKNPVIPQKLYADLKQHYSMMPGYELPNDRVKVPAAWLIENCGFKGKSMGDAAVHDKQALVLVNKGNATGHDILELAKAVEKAVYDKFAISISPEVIVL